MKKIFSIIALSVMAIFSLTFISCSDDDDNKSSNSIVGTWTLLEEKGESDYTVTFKSDGTGYSSEKGESYTFTYSINGNNTLILIYDIDNETITYKYEIANNGNTLILYGQDIEEGSWIERFVRKS